MRLAPLVIVILLSVAAASGGDIREFNVSTLERLGRELSRRDAMAAQASDLVFAKYPGFVELSRYT